MSIQLISNRRASALELLPPLAAELRDRDAANSPHLRLRHDPTQRDFNGLLRGVVRSVLAARGGVSELELRLAPELHESVASPDLLEFVVGGVLTQQVEGFDRSEAAVIRVTTSSDERTTTIRILAKNPPSIAAVRAISSPMSLAKACGGNAVMVHCRRILEDLGGSLELYEEDGMVGFALILPKIPVFAPACQVMPPSRNADLDVVHTICKAS